MATTMRRLDEDHGRDERSLRDLVGEATSEVSLLFRKEIELAKLEVKEEATRFTSAAKFFGIAAFGGYLAVLMLSFAAAWGLAELVPVGVAFLIIGVLYLAVAGVGFLAGRTRLREFHAVPQVTVETLKEDVQWLKSRKNSS